MANDQKQQGGQQPSYKDKPPMSPEAAGKKDKSLEEGRKTAADEGDEDMDDEGDTGVEGKKSPSACGDKGSCSSN